MTECYTRFGFGSSVEGERGKLPPCKARSASSSSVAEDYAYYPRRKSHTRIHPIIYDGMALHVQGVLRKGCQLRCITLPVSSEDQEGERTRCRLRSVVTSVRHADYQSRRVVKKHSPTRQTLGACSTGYGVYLCACASDI